ncbi:tRNA methyltransferase complex GCD14 subunit domain containing protein [Elaphomyces granulatus]
MPSPFLSPSSVSQPDDLAILHLRRDLLIPTILQTHDDEDLGYEEGKVTNTRFGSFPHSTLLGKPWGSQIVASVVDTGSRGRRRLSKKLRNDTRHLKRKADELDSPGISDEAKPLLKPAIAASSGFIHLLHPTPESWTASLPHRTQVVYTPDYSYILHRLRVRPGSTIIEAGAGSGSFTHAAARAVFNGYPTEQPATKKRCLGQVYSFEFHTQRVEKISKEIEQHRLDGLVEVTHRDVYNDGFLLGNPKTGASPNANAVFLDLPAPWQALKHLVRESPSGPRSPLDPSSPVHICTFSPCLEQAQRTISTLRQQSWLSISMVEVHHKRIEVRREGYGLDSGSLRGGTMFPKSVDEAISKLLVAEDRAKQFREAQIVQKESLEATPDYKTGENEDCDTKSGLPDKFATVSSSQSQVPSVLQGRLVHRTEPELKTHTSYLVFAVLPCSWSEADEQRCRQSWPSGNLTAQIEEMVTPKSKKELKREAYAERQRQKAQQQQQKTGAGSPEQGKQELEPKK